MEDKDKDKDKEKEEYYKRWRGVIQEWNFPEKKKKKTIEEQNKFIDEYFEVLEKQYGEPSKDEHD